MSTSTFVAMGAEGALFGIHAQIVQAIVADGEWEGREPFDITAALGLSPCRTGTAHPVLLVGTGEKRAPLRALGSVTVRQIDVAAVWPVPALVRSPFQRQAVAAVAFATGELPLLVLDPLALMAMVAERDTP